MGFIVSKFWVIIGTVLVFLTKIDYFRNKKIIYLFLTIFSLIATGLFLLHRPVRQTDTQCGQQCAAALQKVAEEMAILLSRTE